MSDTGTQISRSWRRMLEARPLRNNAVRIEKDSKKNVIIYVKASRPKYLVPPLSWIVPFRPERRVILDRLGTQVWNLCNGERTVENVVDIFGEQHHLTFHEARVAVTGYIKILTQRGVLAIVLREEK